ALRSSRGSIRSNRGARWRGCISSSLGRVTTGKGHGAGRNPMAGTAVVAAETVFGRAGQTGDGNERAFGGVQGLRSEPSFRDAVLNQTRPGKQRGFAGIPVFVRARPSGWKE